MEVGEKKNHDSLTWVRGVSRHVETGLRRARTARRAPRSVLTRDRHNGIAYGIRLRRLEQCLGHYGLGDTSRGLGLHGEAQLL